VRRLPLTGLLFVACFALAVIRYGNGAGSAPAGIVAYYASHANRLRQIEGFAALLAGCVFLLVYVAVLARELVREEPLASIALVCGAGMTLLLAAGNALWGATAFTAEIEGGFRITPATHLLVEDTGFALVVTGAAVGVPFVLATSIAVARSRVLPRWFVLLGAVAALGLAAAYWYWPLAAFAVWVACGSVLLATREAAERARAAGRSAPTR